MENYVGTRRIPKRESSNPTLSSYTSADAVDKRSLQDRFLTALIDSQTEVDVYLKNDSLRRGKIASYDNWSVLLYAEGKQYLLFKSSIMSLIPAEVVNLNQETESWNPAPTRVAEKRAPYSYGGRY